MIAHSKNLTWLNSIVTSFPEDIIWNIINEVKDRTTLKNLAIVSRAFLFYCQRRLFEYVHLSPYEQHCRNLNAILASRPHLRSYIRRLRLVEGIVRLKGGNYVTWFNRDPLLPPLLMMLSDLQSLYLSEFSWETLNPVLQSSLLQLLRLPSLIKLELDRAIVPPCLFPHSFQLEELRLPAYHDGLARITIPDDIPQGVIRPRTLAVSSKLVSMSGVPREIDLSCIRKLILIDNVALSKHETVRPLVKACLALDHFIWHTSMHSGSTPPLDVIASSKIRFLEVGIAECLGSLGSRPSHWALSVLTEMASYSSKISLQRITFQVNFKRMEQYQRLVGLDAWEEMDRLLATNKGFADFRQLTFNISILCPDAEKVRGYTAQLMAKFHRLATRDGVLHINNYSDVNCDMLRRGYSRTETDPYMDHLG